MRRFAIGLFVGLTFLLSALALHSAQAQETVPGDPCSNANQVRQVGGPESATAGYTLVCNGSTWVALKEWTPATGQSLFQIGDDNGGCTTDKNGRIRFDSNDDPPWQFCDGLAWHPFKQPRCQDDGAGACFIDAQRMDSDPDFIPENIIAGTSILDVIGTLVEGMDTAIINAGYFAACAVDAAGAARCWGYGALGQLGNGSYNTPSGLVFVSAGGLSGTTWTNIAVGRTNSCGLRDDGTAWCWGQGTYGANGNSSTSNQNTPVSVNATATSGTSWIDIDAGGFHVCGVRDDGTGWCWGNDGNGGLGNGATAGNLSAPSPITLTGVSGTAWTKIRNGYSNSCGLRDDGTAWCWGYNYYGALGNGNTTQQTAPVAVSTGGVSGTAWTDVSVSIGYHACGVRNDGTAWCWGYGEDGEMGDGTYTVTNSTPRQVSTTGVSGTAWTQVATTEWSNCGLRDDGTAWCWGYNTYGQLGNNSILSTNTPVMIDDSDTTGTAWTNISGGGNYACGLRDDGTAWCWGDPTYGTLAGLDFGAIRPVAE
ncbi:MAG: hypothetical protein HYS17_00985 [Micavibrio aeruginosavorus]|uniref:Regulator of chromosome condensation family protein n=1 Tax=Micavibrio aeruginosavorus TaxID=349221 RepID=A0A7T5R2K8_9BACT|nr:MAG: hypothetical protein HYS17_00985 [Micavibrio aeruginosavorus]